MYKLSSYNFEIRFSTSQTYCVARRHVQGGNCSNHHCNCTRPVHAPDELHEVHASAQAALRLLLVCKRSASLQLEGARRISRRQAANGEPNHSSPGSSVAVDCHRVASSHRSRPSVSGQRRNRHGSGR